MDYIYSRVSTEKQTCDGQRLKLTKAYPEAKITEETESGVKDRPMLEALIKSMVSGDRLIIFSLDRLGRRAHQVLPMLEGLKDRGITLISMREGVDYTTMSGKLVTQIFVSMAEMEREITVERTKAGLEAARIRGTKRNGDMHISMGRPKEIPQEILDKAIALVEGGMSIPKAANECEYKDKNGVDKKLSVSYVRKLMKQKNN